MSYAHAQFSHNLIRAQAQPRERSSWSLTSRGFSASRSYDCVHTHEVAERPAGTGKESNDLGVCHKVCVKELTL